MYLKIFIIFKLFQKVIFFFFLIYGINFFKFLLFNHIIFTKIIIFFFLLKLALTYKQSQTTKALLTIAITATYLVCTYWDFYITIYNFFLFFLFWQV